MQAACQPASAGGWRISAGRRGRGRGRRQNLPPVRSTARQNGPGRRGQPSMQRERAVAWTALPVVEFGGARGSRTPDLVNAIHALSQLSYAPVRFRRAEAQGFRRNPESSRGYGACQATRRGIRGSDTRRGQYLAATFCVQEPAPLRRLVRPVRDPRPRVGCALFRDGGASCAASVIDDPSSSLAALPSEAFAR